MWPYGRHPNELIFGQPTLPSVRTLVEQLAAFASHFDTTTWGGRHGYLPLVPDQKKMCLFTTDGSLNCAWLKKPALIHPNTANDTKGRDLVQFQEDHKLRWMEYHFHIVINAVEVEAIVAAVGEQYMDKLKDDYVGYNNQTIKTMVLQLPTWFFITNIEKVATLHGATDPTHTSPPLPAILINVILSVLTI